MRMTIIRPNLRATARGITERASLGHQAVEVTVLSAADVADYGAFMRHLRRPRAGVRAPAPLR